MLRFWFSLHRSQLFWHRVAEEMVCSKPSHLLLLWQWERYQFPSQSWIAYCLAVFKWMDICFPGFGSDLAVVVCEPLTMIFQYPLTRQAAEGGVQYRWVHRQNEQHLTERLKERLLLWSFRSGQASLSGRLVSWWRLNHCCSQCTSSIKEQMWTWKVLCLRLRKAWVCLH